MSKPGVSSSCVAGLHEKLIPCMWLTYHVDDGGSKDLWNQIWLEVLTAVTMKMAVFWVVVLIPVYMALQLREQPSSTSEMLVNLILVCMVLQCRRQLPLYSPLWQSQILLVLSILIHMLSICWPVRSWLRSCGIWPSALLKGWLCVLLSL
jgi:hypothetical protein